MQVSLRAERTLGDEVLRFPVVGSARLPADGEFRIEVTPDGVPVDPVEISVAAATGVEVHRLRRSLEQVTKPLRLRVQTVDRVEVVPSDEPNLGARTRITGQVVDQEGRRVPPDLPVVIWGVDPAAEPDSGGDSRPARPLVITATRSDGRFGADWVDDVLASASGSVAGGARQPVPLAADGRLPQAILLVVGLDDDEMPDDDCGCSATPPRMPDQADLTGSPEAFSQDLGGGCVDLTMPNRVIEEFAYFQVVRTSEPRVAGLTLNPRRAVPSDLLADLLGVSIASQALGLTRPTSVALQTTNLTLDVHAARSLVRTDRPPSVAAITRAAWLSEVTATTDMIDAGLQTASGRTVLDAEHAIDWDYTPRIHPAVDIAYGHLLQIREVWRADGYSLGDLLYSLPLAPGQRRQVAVVDWDRRTSSAREERLEYEEHLDALLSRDRAVLEMVGTDLHEEVAAGSRNTTWGVAGGIGAGFIGSGFGIFGGVAGGTSGSSSLSWQDAARTFAADSMQQLRDRVSQRSSALRSQRSSVVQSVSQGETLRAETEVVANYNRCHAMTVEYFEVLRHFLVTHELADVRECLFVPLPLAPFDRAKALRWREVLGRFLRRSELRGGFDAIERIADNWVGWDFPVARYSEEAPESIEGELRISFLLPRPRDAADGRYQVDMWQPLAPFLNVDTLELFTAKLNERTARERDRIFRTEIAPGIAERLVQRLRLAFVGPDGGESEVPVDATLVSRYAESVPLYVTVNQAGAVPSVPRDDIAHVKIWYDGPPLPPDAQVIVHSGRLRYRAPHLSAVLFDDARIIDDIKLGDAVVVAAPLSQSELRNPRQEDVKLADLLVAHLNDHLEFYHQAIWMSLDAQRRYMLLDAVEVPGLDGRSVASLCSNQVIGIVGNSLVLPVAPGLRLDPTLTEAGGDVAPVPLVNAYAAPPAPPLRVSVPTRGVFAEAVAGSCNACESVDDTRYWRWSTDGQLELPEISPVSTESRAGEEPDLTPTPLPAPLVQIQNAPAVPDPVGLRAAFELLSKPGLFQDVTGLEGTQRNAAAAFEASLSAAAALGDEAAKLASQQELGRNAERMLDRINQARGDGLLSQSEAQDLATSALRGLVGEPRPGAQNPTTDPVVDGVIDKAAQGAKADIKVTSPSETVEVSFADDRGVVGGGFTPSPPLELREQIRQAVIVEPSRTSMTPYVLDTYDLLEALLGTRLADAEALGVVKQDPLDEARYTVERRLRIVYPADPSTPRRVAGTGRLPVAVIVHGQYTVPGTLIPSLNGYQSVQDELARHGIVSVSVDTNAANLFDAKIEMRAQMVLGALDALRNLDADPSSQLHRRLDFDRVALMGHSRGGDAVIRAARKNSVRTASTRYGIQAVCALAPTDHAFGHPEAVTLTTSDTPFFAVVYGALDGDVAGGRGAREVIGTGFRHYDRATCNRAMVFMDHCNHNRFNSEWFKAGDDKALLPNASLLSDTDHEKLADEYIGGLFRWRLLGDAKPKGLFNGTATNTLGAGVSLQWSFGEQIQVLDDMEDPGKPRTLTGGFIYPFPDVVIGTRLLDKETNHVTTVLVLEPPVTSGVAYSIALPPGSESDWTNYNALTFRVCADYDFTSQDTIDAGQLPDFSVVITDRDRASMTIAASTLSGPLVPRRPVWHWTVGSSTVLRLETMTLPVAALTGIKKDQIAEVGLMAAPGMLRHLFFDSIQLVRH
ncbi:poly(ethylene terephthalate) hydrolase family protein [Micromonospora sp. LZ34]